MKTIFNSLILATLSVAAFQAAAASGADNSIDHAQHHAANAASASTEAAAPDPMASMLGMHQKMLAARTAEERQQVILDYRDVMDQGMPMMQGGQGTGKTGTRASGRKTVMAMNNMAACLKYMSAPTAPSQAQ